MVSFGPVVIPDNVQTESGHDDELVVVPTQHESGRERSITVAAAQKLLKGQCDQALPNAPPSPIEHRSLAYWQKMNRATLLEKTVEASVYTHDTYVRITSPLNPFLITPEVLFFSPPPSTVVDVDSCAGSHNRMIFLNVPLLEDEQTQLHALRAQYMKNNLHVVKNADCPGHIQYQRELLRVLQDMKGDPEKAFMAITQRYNFLRSVTNALSEQKLQANLASGFMYFHGRDKLQRPVLVVRPGKLDLSLTADSLVEHIVFTLQWAIEYALVPGRVENWITLIDMEGAPSVVSMDLLKELVNTLQNVYRYRSALTLVLHPPWIASVVWKTVQTFLPEDSKARVVWAAGKQGLQKVMSLIQPHQLEQSFGGTAPNLKQGEFYPFKFFPDAPAQPPPAEPVLDRIFNTASGASFWHSCGVVMERHANVPEVQAELIERTVDVMRRGFRSELSDGMIPEPKKPLVSDVDALLVVLNEQERDDVVVDGAKDAVSTGHSPREPHLTKLREPSGRSATFGEEAEEPKLSRREPEFAAPEAAVPENGVLEAAVPEVGAESRGGQMFSVQEEEGDELKENASWWCGSPCVL